ncbi:MAG: hypothetical protein JNM66_14505 [Bryobacterales bacterium]|nr:hypothetical protein [Bryobacterales bacterium]
MTLTIALPWFRGRRVPPADRSQARFTRVLKSAVAGTRYAREYDRGADGYAQLPRVDLLEFLCHTERYAVANQKVPRERLFYPLGEAPRTAVVARRVEETRRVRRFSGLRAEGLAAYGPHVLAAPLDALRAARAEPVAHPPLRNALIVFTGVLEGPLTPQDSDDLWRRYQVPVFEQFLGMDGELLAWECEVHHGLHVRESAAHFEGAEGDRLLVSFLANPRLPVLRLETGLTGRLVSEPCPCGDSAPRLVDMRRRTVRRATSVMAMAATA